MAKSVKDVLKKKIGFPPTLPGEAPEQGPETDDTAEVSEAATQNPATATTVINAEHVIALAHMTIANQTALMQLVEKLRPLFLEHGQVTEALGHMIPQHVAMATHIANNIVPQGPATPMSAPVPTAPVMPIK